MNKITKVYLSPFTNIYQNLCLEDYLLRNFTDELVLFYQNDPCVVMGNFQNPWKETNPITLAENEVALARRQSGGGTVFQDMGNLNFCFFRNKQILSEEDKNFHLDHIRKLLLRENIETDRLPKSGMVFLKEGKRFKFSGEAFKQTSKRSFHHGTLLIKSDLKALEKFLGPALSKVETKAISSNPHLVGNLSDVWPDLTPSQFFKQFSEHHQLESFELDFGKLHNFITERAPDLAAREQVLEKTPEFQVPLSGKVLTVKCAQVIAEDGIEVTPRDFSGEKF